MKGANDWLSWEEMADLYKTANPLLRFLIENEEKRRRSEADGIAHCACGALLVAGKCIRCEEDKGQP
jgi:hypothetical protein